MKKDGAYVVFLVFAAVTLAVDLIFALCLAFGLTNLFGGKTFILGGLSFWSAVVFIVNVACALVTFFYVKKRRE